jgi:FixJ family two-component response regulator
LPDLRVVGNRTPPRYIDDDLEVSDALARLLKALGLSTATVSSAESFLATGELERTCCLITDIMLSVTSGLALQACLTDGDYRSPMISITAFPEQQFRAQAMGAGADELHSVWASHDFAGELR